MENPSLVVPLTENDITQSEASPREQQLIQALNGVANWRANKKKPAEPIPHELWFQIFALEEWYPPSQLRSFFSVSTKQYAVKKEALMSEQNEVSKAALKPEKAKASKSSVKQDTPQLCGVNIIKENKATKKSHAKINPYALEPLPSAKTLVVEFCRSDG